MINHKLWAKIASDMVDYSFMSSEEATLTLEEQETINVALEAMNEQFQKIRPIFRIAQKRFLSRHLTKTE